MSRLETNCADVCSSSLHIFRFNRGHVPRSLNLPQGQSFSREGALLPTGDGAQLKKQRGKSIIVFGNKHNDTAEVSRRLIQ